MNREIKFRGTCRTTNKMVVGNLVIDYGYKELKENSIGELQSTAIYDMYSIHGHDDNTWHEIDPNTLGAYTGLKDYNNNEIFTGDILSSKWLCEVYSCHKTGAYMVKFKNTDNRDRTLYDYLNQRDKAGTSETDCVVIGNIFQNSELLK